MKGRKYIIVNCWRHVVMMMQPPDESQICLYKQCSEEMNSDFYHCHMKMHNNIENSGNGVTLT